MTFPAITRRFPALALLAVATLVASGCALDRLPRIDPSGDRILLFPSDEPAPPVAAAPGVTPPPVAGIAPPAPNAVAPPVLAEERGCFLSRLLCGPTVVGPAVGQPVVGQPVPVNSDRVTITPERVLAPVGSEVIVRAGLCQASGYLLTNERIEWSLGRQGVGQFVTLGSRGEGDPLRLPWHRPSKVDNEYAIGYTSPVHRCLRRHSADPLDDVQIRPGDAWVSVTSPAEGTSYVTAFAPGVADWASRTTTAVIYWIDAQWQLPPSTTVPAGQPHPLTTTITRKSDGAPIAGWIVQYEVSGAGGAALGYEAGQTAEAVTDNQGRATITVNPTDDGPGTATVNIKIVRPENAGAGGGPRVTVGEGVASVTWATDAIQPGLPPIGSPPLGSQPPGSQPPTFEPPINQPPPVSPQPVGQPSLDVRLERLTPDPILLGDPVRYKIIVRNTGTADARQIVIKSSFDAGLSNEYDTQGKSEIVYDQMSDLAPGESDSIDVDFDTLQEGTRVVDVSVTAIGVQGPYDRQTFQVEALQPDPPQLDVRMVSGPRYVEGQPNDPQEIRGVVENRGSAPATNVIVRVRIDRSLRISLFEEAVGRETVDALGDGGYEWRLPELPAGSRRVFRLQCEFLQPTRESRIVMEVTADGGYAGADEARFEILPRAGAGPGTGPPAGLGLSLSTQTPSVRAGTSSTLSIFMENTGTAVERDVIVDLLLPPGLQANVARIVAPTAAQRVENALRFDPLAQLPPGAREAILVPFDAVQPGAYTIQARIYSAGDAEPRGQSIQSIQLRVDPR
ncbi:MAG: hypothetical protein AAGJ46_06565 [Planctomycetota bacterium]